MDVKGRVRDTYGGARLWRRIDEPGHEWARLARKGAARVLRGTAVFREGGVPARLDYRIVCDAAWTTAEAVVLGWKGADKVDLRIARDAGGNWTLNGGPVPGVAGCADLDLAFSPSTNMLPMRRLAPGVGETVEVRAAWLRYPELDLVTLVHRFRPLDARRVAYDADVGFSTGLVFDPEGWVEEYPPLWTAE